MTPRPIRWLFVATFAFAFCAMARADVQSGNIVGYMGANVKRGDNTIGMPKKVNGDQQLVEDVLQGLVDGDAILVVDRLDEQHWGRVVDDGEEKHVYVEGYDEPVDDWRLPSIAGEQVLKVKRTEDVETQTPLTGEFDCESPIQLPEYTGEAPLSKIRLGKETAKNLQTVVTITNRVSVPFPTTVAKKFEMILKSGRRIVVQVDPNTRLIVDAETGKPVNVGAAEIEGFGEIKSVDIPKAEKAETAEIRPIAKDVAKGATDYDFRKAIREGIVGAAWDDEHKLQSILWGLVVVAVLSLLNKIFDWGWGWAFKGAWWFTVRFFSACACVAKAWGLLLMALVNAILWVLRSVLMIGRKRRRTAARRAANSAKHAESGAEASQGLLSKIVQRVKNRATRNFRC